MNFPRLFPVSLVALGAACTAPARPTALAPAAAAGQPMVEDRLYFGRNLPTGGTVSDSAWSAFMAEVVTPRFPDGLTVYQGQGQWKDPRGTIVHETTMVLELEHQPGVAMDSVIALIAEAYRTRFHQDAVLRITAPVELRLYPPARH